LSELKYRRAQEQLQRMRLNVISSHNPSRQIGGRSKKKSPAVVAGPSWPRHAEDGKRAPEALLGGSR